MAFPGQPLPRAQPAAKFPLPAEPPPTGYRAPDGSEGAGDQPGGYLGPDSQPGDQSLRWQPGGDGGWPSASHPSPAQPPAPAAPPAPRRGTRRRRWLAGLLLIAGLCGLVGSALGIVTQLAPRTFTAAQRQRIMAWEVGRRWRTLPAGLIFPAEISYRLPGAQFGSSSGLALTAHRLSIARQERCASAAGQGLEPVLRQRGCQALLRATYADATRSFVLTVGVAVLRNQAVASSAAGDLTSRRGLAAAAALQPVLRPVAVPGTPAALFGLRQRQLSWVDTAGPYLVIATVGFADGRPKVPVRTDGFAQLEMTSLAGGVDAAVARPLAAPPPAPHCPGSPGC